MSTPAINEISPLSFSLPTPTASLSPTIEVIRGSMMRSSGRPLDVERVRRIDQATQWKSIKILTCPRLQEWLNVNPLGMGSLRASFPRVNALVVNYNLRIPFKNELALSLLPRVFGPQIASLNWDLFTSRLKVSTVVNRINQYCQRLQSLQLKFTDEKDVRFVSQIKVPTLNTVKLFQVPDLKLSDFYQLLVNHPQLAHLECQYSTITGEEIEFQNISFPQLETLKLFSFPDLTFNGLRNILRLFPNLRNLEVALCALSIPKAHLLLLLKENPNLKSVLIDEAAEDAKKVYPLPEFEITASFVRVVDIRNASTMEYDREEIPTLFPGIRSFSVTSMQTETDPLISSNHKTRMTLSIKK